VTPLWSNDFDDDDDDDVATAKLPAANESMNTASICERNSKPSPDDDTLTVEKHFRVAYEHAQAVNVTRYTVHDPTCDSSRGSSKRSVSADTVRSGGTPLAMQSSQSEQSIP